MVRSEPWGASVTQSCAFPGVPVHDTTMLWPGEYDGELVVAVGPEIADEWLSSTGVPEWSEEQAEDASRSEKIAMRDNGFCMGRWFGRWRLGLRVRRTKLPASC